MTHPAPITQLSPMVTPFNIVTFEPFCPAHQVNCPERCCRDIHSSRLSVSADVCPETDRRTYLICANVMLWRGKSIRNS